MARDLPDLSHLAVSGARIAVRVTPHEAGRVRIAVTDTGIGIAAEDLARLAQPFEQVEGQHSKTTQGTGLGLPIEPHRVYRRPHFLRDWGHHDEADITQIRP